MTHRLPRLVLLLATLSCAACTRPADSQFLKQHLGERCVVQFRRDALGAAAALPVSPKTDSVNGADVSLFGRLVSVERGGLVLEERTTQLGAAPVSHWIPYPVILNVRFTGAKKE